LADNLAVTPGSGATVACDDIASVLYQRTKLSLGADGSATDALGGVGAVAAGVQRVTLADHGVGEYETVAAGQTAQVLGGTGAAGDYLKGLIIVPAVVACGVVTILDNAISIPVFVGGGTTPLVDAKPFYVPIGLYSVSGAWKVTTGANVSVIAIGNFAA
jgi:hypothetical protein